MIVRAGSIVAAAALAAAAVPLVVASVPAAATTTHVGIVVRLSDSSTVTKCVTVGGSGLDVLTRGFPNTQIGSSGPYAGFVLQINGVGQNPPDNTHYWSYWHSPGTGTWTYSGTGAGSSTPKAGTVEGWSYVNGQNDATKPPRYTYAQLCASADPTTTPAPSHPPTHPPTRTAVPPPSVKASPHPARRHTTAAPASLTRTPTPTPTTTPTTTHVWATRSARTSVHPQPSVTQRSRMTLQVIPSTPVQTTAPAPAVSPAISNAAAASSQQASSGFPAWGTIVAIVVILALGGGAWLRLRRRPE